MVGMIEFLITGVASSYVNNDPPPYKELKQEIYINIQILINKA